MNQQELHREVAATDALMQDQAWSILYPMLGGLLHPVRPQLPLPQDQELADMLDHDSV